MLNFFPTEEGGWQEIPPEQLREGLKVWEDFNRQATDAGVYIAGDGLQHSETATTMKIGEGSDRMVTDGPFAETKEQLGGFVLLECADLDEALDWARKVPLGEGGSIEVRPVMDWSQFTG